MSNNTGVVVGAAQLREWFNIGSRLSKFHLEASATGGIGLPGNEKEATKPIKRSEGSRETDYVKEYLAREAANLQKRLNSNEGGSQCLSLDQPLSHLSEVDEVTTVGAIPNIGDLDQDLTQVYQNYEFTHQYNSKLLVARYKEDIVNSVESQHFLIIEGSTGSGKTTQVPQYILDHYVQLNRHCNIIVTQPRRLAAISVAKRVCHERGWPVGGLVGYQVGLNKEVKPETRLLYVTTGVLLQRLIKSKHMNEFTHIILDEVHERDQEMDMCLLLVKKFLHTVSRQVKVILMSATFDVDLFGNYFAMPVNNKMEKPITISLAGKSYSVSEHWINDLASLGPIPDLDPTTPAISPLSYNLAYNLVKMFDSIEKREQGAETNGFAPNRGSVLIFLPGIGEIHRLDEMFSNEKLRHRWWILPLHSTITVEEQSRVFEAPQPGDRKIILSTNIAESSVTVTDVKYVIDFCLTRNLFCDNDTNFTHLRLEWASKANCKQRKGRAGRVSTGRVYRMITSEFYDNFLPEFIVPEMKRCPLEQIVLKVKMLGLEEPKGILALALEPPNLSDIERAIVSLKEVGALDLLTNGVFYPFDGDLTFIGRVLAALPLDIHVGKLICLGFIFGCLEMCIVIAAGLSLKTCFSTPLKNQLNAFRNKVAWSDGSFSDCIAVCKAFRLWKGHRMSNRFRRTNTQSEKEWCTCNYLQLKRLEEMAVLVEELTGRLERLNIKCDPQRENSGDLLMLQIVIAGAFYPHYFIRVPSDEENILRTLSGHDPLTTVVLSGLPANQGILYQHEIEQFFEKYAPPVSCHFEDTKAYVEFGRSKEAEQQRILPMVVLSVKMRLLKIPLELTLYAGEELALKLHALELLTTKQTSSGRLRTNRMSAVSTRMTIQPVALPSLQDIAMSLYVTRVIECGHFWAHYGTDDTFNKLKELAKVIDRHIDSLVPIGGAISPGDICLAPDISDSGQLLGFGRARVEKVIRKNELEVFFVDYGGTQKVLRDQVRAIDDFLAPIVYGLPMQSFECQLSEIKASAIISPSGSWCKAATLEFGRMVCEKAHNARIYSVVHNVIHLELILTERDGREFSLNKHLINLGYAEHADEGILSKQNNILRQKYSTSQQLFDLYQESELKLCLDTHLKYGPAKGKRIKLKGPESPLEIQYMAVTHAARTKQVRIEANSVNSVSLDAEPQDECDRMLVAAHVGLTASASALTAHDTTLMPNIHGLPALLSLLFAPCAELRCDIDYQHYTGALCGLGYDLQTEEPLYPEHDIEMTFDTSFSTDDLIIINAIRMSIHWILRNSTDSFHLTSSVMAQMQERIRERVHELLKTQRKVIDRIPCKQPYKWKVVADDKQLKPDLESRDPDCEHVLHRGIELVEPGNEDRAVDNTEHMVEHVKELHAKASRSMQRQDITCQLCNLTFVTPHQLLFHLKSPVHHDLETQLLDRYHYGDSPEFQM